MTLRGQKPQKTQTVVAHSSTGQWHWALLKARYIRPITVAVLIAFEHDTSNDRYIPPITLAVLIVKTHRRALTQRVR